MDVKSAEMTKYAANSFLAVKISFANEIANICEKVGADAEMVRIGMCSDHRIGPKFLFPGLGYGGSCFPKDVKAMINTAKKFSCGHELLSAADSVNATQRQLFIDKIIKRIDSSINNLNIKNIPKIKRKINTLNEVGLGYIKLGQPATTLSGGEAQRVKLATELSKKSTGKTLYILDEPTTGLHIADVHKLTEVIQKLAASGNTIIIIEHNLDLIKICDYIVDLGPEGGENGGNIIATGTPEEIIKYENSYTGKYLKKYI